MKKTYPELCTEWEQRLCGPNADSELAALTIRLGIEGLTYAEIEARIARWEALEDAAGEYYCLNGFHLLAEDNTDEENLRACSATGIVARLNRAAAQVHTQNLQPVINAELVKKELKFWSRYPEEPVPVDPATIPCVYECACGGPAGHVPNGLLCRKGMR